MGQNHLSELVDVWVSMVVLHYIVIEVTLNNWWTTAVSYEPPHRGNMGMVKVLQCNLELTKHLEE